MGVLAAAARSAGVCSTSYAPELQGVRQGRRWLPPRRQQARTVAPPPLAAAAGTAAAALAATPAAAALSLASHWRTFLPPRPGLCSSSGSRSSMRGTACHAFGDNLRRLAGGGGRAEQPGGQQQDGSGGGPEAESGEKTSVWSDWQGECYRCLLAEPLKAVAPVPAQRDACYSLLCSLCITPPSCLLRLLCLLLQRSPRRRIGRPGRASTSLTWTTSQRWVDARRMPAHAAAPDGRHCWSLPLLHQL